MNFITRLIELIVSIFAPKRSQSPTTKPQPPTPPTPTTTPIPTEPPPPVTRKVLMITHNPVMQTKEGRKLNEVYGWTEPDVLAQKYIDDLRDATYGYANYEIVERVVVDGFPVKEDGFVYDEASYLQIFETREFHKPDRVDYLKLVREFEMIEKINAGTIDEVWLFGFPYGGYYESIMAGPGAFWCNAPALKGTDDAKRLFVIMGFNFERGVGEMHESFGHRAESIMERVYKGYAENEHVWRRFIRYEKTHPGQAECGNVHFAPNSESDYDWGNMTPVMTRADNWYDFPNLTAAPIPQDARNWGSGDIRAHHVWWFKHFPHIGGETNGISNNWWQYVVDPNTVPSRLFAFEAEVEPERQVCSHGFEGVHGG